MRRDDLADTLVAAGGEDGFVFPPSTAYRFNRVAPTALAAIDAAPTDSETLPEDVFEGVALAGVDHVVVVLVDGLGYDMWRRAEPQVPLLEAVAEAGVVTPLSAGFPSETAAAIPSLHTGVPPIEHGLLGWHQYVAELPAAVQALPWTTQADEPVPSVYEHPPDWAETFVDATPLYARVEITTTVIQPSSITHSASGRALTRGTDGRIGYEQPEGAAAATRRALSAAIDPSYTLVYLPDVDTAAHHDGPESDAAHDAVRTIGTEMADGLCGEIDPATAARTLIVVTADHGQTHTAGDNRDIRGYAPIWTNLATGPDGRSIPPVGSSRNLQLFLEAGRDEVVSESLERDFDCRALTREEYECRDLFGEGTPGAGYRRRAPDVVCLHRNRGLWYEDEGLQEVGKHGGLTRAEMIVPFGAARLDRIQQTLGTDPTASR